jgi:hypothetical protein
MIMSEREFDESHIYSTNEAMPTPGIEQDIPVPESTSEIVPGSIEDDTDTINEPSGAGLMGGPGGDSSSHT